ncbi:hypothetical protein [Halomontanus rarus]
MSGDREIKHAVTCPDCGKPTFAWERYCHRCNADRWSHRDR